MVAIAHDTADSISSTIFGDSAVTKRPDPPAQVSRGRQKAVPVEYSTFVYALNRSRKIVEHLASLVDMMKSNDFADYICEANTLLNRDIPGVERRLNAIVGEMGDFIDAHASGVLSQRESNREKTNARKKKTN